MSSSPAGVKISPGAIVCNECELVGDITVGARTVIHPKARIIAEGGPIVIGENNLVEEQVQIVNPAPQEESAPSRAMTIGCNNVFEVGCYSEALKMGDNNVLEAKCKVGRHTELSNGCVIGAACHVTIGEVIPENTVIYGDECKRRVQAERPAPQTLQLDFLTKILPNYHHLKKPTKKA